MILPQQLALIKQDKIRGHLQSLYFVAKTQFLSKR